MIRCFAAMGVLLQAFYWDCPREAGVERGWWRHVSARLDGLRAAGFTALWLPPCRRRQHDVDGLRPVRLSSIWVSSISAAACETWFGSKTDLVVARRRGAPARDAGVRRRRLQPHERRRAEYNPDYRREGWTRFRPASGRFEFDYACFHPSRFQRHDGESWGGMPDLCHRNPVVYEAVMAHANMLITRDRLRRVPLRLRQGLRRVDDPIDPRAAVRARPAAGIPVRRRRIVERRTTRSTRGWTRSTATRQPDLRLRLSAALSAERHVRHVWIFAAAPGGGWDRDGGAARSRGHLRRQSRLSWRRRAARSSTTS